MARKAWLALVWGGLAACAAASPNGDKPQASATPPPTATASAPKVALVEDAGAPDAEPPPTPPTPEPPKSCPADMILVDGDYCTEVEQTCLKSWFDKSNKKKVCEEFQKPSKCIGSKVKKRFCIDKYSWPNKKGERAEVMNNFYQAQVKCASLGKRMCTESEWTFACEGPDMKPYPYGYVRDTTKCNGDHAWDGPNMKKVAARDAKELARLWKGVRNGEQPGCVSDFGVPDLPGNTDDLASSETVPTMKNANFDNVTIGGPWYKGVRNQCRPRIYTHDEGFYYYYLSFRCCSEPDGATTDPRAPKQIKRGEPFKKIEGLAGFSIDDMKKKLELKAKGQCTCKDKDVLCKTMCGTLLDAGNPVDVKL